MKYFAWSEQEVMNMSYEKFIMYLATIPNYDEDDEKESTQPKKEKATGSFNLFDLDQRKT